MKKYTWVLVAGGVGIVGYFLFFRGGGFSGRKKARELKEFVSRSATKPYSGSPVGGGK